MSYHGNQFSRKDHEVLQKAAEARKQGKRLPEYDEKGELINPYIPMYISKAPWYMKTGNEAEGPPTGKTSLEHQRIVEKVLDSSAHHVRGILVPGEEGAGGATTKFRKGACENCGAATHKKQDCLERPRKRGARWSGKDIRPDEFVQEAALDFEGKRDRWAGYDEEEYSAVIQSWERAEEERRALKREQKGATEESGPGDSDDDDDDDEEEEEDIYAEAVDMPGQKVDLKTRMTVRNLRLREDTAKYLTDLCADPALYDPKTRSMRRAPSSTGGSESFVSAEAAEREGQVFAWEMHDRMSQRPSGAAAAASESSLGGPAEGRSAGKLDPVLERRYGLAEAGSNGRPPALYSVEESDTYVEYDLQGRVVKTTKH